MRPIPSSSSPRTRPPKITLREGSAKATRLPQRTPVRQAIRSQCVIARWRRGDFGQHTKRLFWGYPLPVTIPIRGRSAAVIDPLLALTSKIQCFFGGIAHAAAAGGGQLEDAWQFSGKPGPPRE